MLHKMFVAVSGSLALVVAACATTGQPGPSPEQISQYAVAGVKVANAAVEIAKAVDTINRIRGAPKN